MPIRVNMPALMRLFFGRHSWLPLMTGHPFWEATFDQHLGWLLVRGFTVFVFPCDWLFCKSKKKMIFFLTRLFLFAQYSTFYLLAQSQFCVNKCPSDGPKPQKSILRGASMGHFIAFYLDPQHRTWDPRGRCHQVFNTLIIFKHEALFKHVKKNPIRLQICTCHDSWAVVTCAKFGPDRIIAIHILAKKFLTRFQLRAH